MGTKKRIILVVSLTVVIVLGSLAYLFLRPGAKISLSAAEILVQDVSDQVMAERLKAIETTDEQISFGDKNEINILTLGIDSRKEGAENHCDAIHLVTLNIEDWTIKITSVPRGTFSPLPPGREYLSTDYYLSNACGFGGLEYGIDQIEKVLGIKADYVATVGFSEALGIFRTLNLPTTATLQWLRHRQTYAIGDPQRSQNQATFMKDMALRLTKDGMSPTLLYLLHSFVDTDLPYSAAKALYDGYRASDLGDHPERITFDMKPYFATQELHLDTSAADDQVSALVERLKGHLSADDLSLKTVDEIQGVLVDYLREGLGDPDKIKHIVDDRLWDQVEDSSVREELHYRFIVKYIDSIRGTSPAEAQKLATDYVLEMEYFGLDNWAKKGHHLLDDLIE